MNLRNFFRDIFVPMPTEEDFKRFQKESAEEIYELMKDRYTCSMDNNTEEIPPNKYNPGIEP